MPRPTWPLERVLRDGRIGEVIHARTTLRSNEKDHLSQPGYWRTQYALGGGLILDTGAHSFYLLKWLLGEFEEVPRLREQAVPARQRDRGHRGGPGHASRSGAHLSCMFTSVSEVPHSERLELYGTEGGIILDQMADPVVRVFGGHQDFAGEALAGVPYGPDAWHPGGWHYESVIAEVTDYVHSLVEGRHHAHRQRRCRLRHRGRRGCLPLCGRWPDRGDQRGGGPGRALSRGPRRTRRTGPAPLATGVS